jgi:hypothetical protein
MLQSSLLLVEVVLQLAGRSQSYLIGHCTNSAAYRNHFFTH